MANKVYKLKDDFKEEDLLFIGFTKIPNTEVFAKIIPQDINSDPVRALLINYYENPRWIAEIYPKIKKDLKNEIGLSYNKKGKLIMTEKFKSVICSWVIQINLDDDKWLGFTSYNSREPNLFYNSGILDKFCPKEIEYLKEFNAIEEIEVE